MNTILTDDERRQAIQSVVLTSPGTADQIASAIESAVLAKLAQQPAVAWRYQDAKGNYRYRGYKAGFDVEYAILKPVALYTRPAPQQADRQRVPDEDSPAVCDAYERIDRFLRNNLGDEDYADYSHDLDLLAAAPEAPAQANAVDERYRKDAERYRWLREQHWAENLIGVVIRPKDNAKLGSMLPSLELLDDTIDHMKARAALAQKGGE